jgi:hypothetical protein
MMLLRKKKDKAVDNSMEVVYGLVCGSYRPGRYAPQWGS